MCCASVVALVREALRSGWSRAARSPAQQAGSSAFPTRLQSIPPEATSACLPQKPNTGSFPHTYMQGTMMTMMILTMRGLALAAGAAPVHVLCKDPKPGARLCCGQCCLQLPLILLNQ